MSNESGPSNTQRLNAPSRGHQRETSLTSVPRTSEALEIAEPDVPWKLKNILALGEKPSGKRRLSKSVDDLLSPPLFQMAEVCEVSTPSFSFKTLWNMSRTTRSALSMAMERMQLLTLAFIRMMNPSMFLTTSHLLATTSCHAIILTTYAEPALEGEYAWLPVQFESELMGSRLIAIMLSRLRMSVEDCISEYLRLGSRVFGTPRYFHMLSLPLIIRNRTKYDTDQLEGAIGDVITRRGRNEGPNRIAFKSENENFCKTFVNYTLESRMLTEL